jgi:anti-sigma regulatory factor (Ser/Thr protein kinase)
MSMCWHAHRSYACTDATPRQARGDTTGHLRTVLGDSAAADDTIADVELVVSELVTNAINAACADATLDVDLHHDHVRVAVSDNAPGDPTPQHPTPDQPNGRGLQIVDRLARSWGVLANDDHVKQVWAVLTVPTGLTRGMTCTVSSMI